MRRALNVRCGTAAAISLISRWQSSDEKSKAEPVPTSSTAEQRAKNISAPQAAEAKIPGSNPANGTGTSPYSVSPEEVLDAVKKGDFNRMQSHATQLVQSRWKDEYSVPAACAVIFLVMWYWVAWTRRSIRRRCAAVEASVQQKSEEMVESVRSMTQKWSSDMTKANAQMQGIIDKNSELTKDIDRMTTALRSCSIRPTVMSTTSAISGAPTVQAVKNGSDEAGAVQVGITSNEATSAVQGDAVSPEE